MENRDWLGEFLRRRREALSPMEAGLPSLRRRRTPGLRREEVAALANVSAAYYERLEQARGPRPSVGVLTGIAAALRLTETEKAHLFRLAGHLAPPPWDPQPEPVDPGLAYLLRIAALHTYRPSLDGQDVVASAGSG
ncbi:helix-turn-helix domain-containing protein [Micromonospora sp. CA-246542]|uniref:helix-turn-helix domain-containing protein n=1 Tax=Micromonospora sp. CA-246542 TaxID=3239959 RepID=UPI003D9223AF